MRHPVLPARGISSQHRVGKDESISPAACARLDRYGSRPARSLGMVLFWLKAALMKGWSHPALGSLSIPRAVPRKGTQHTHPSCTSSLLVGIRSEGKPRIVILWNVRIPCTGGNSLVGGGSTSLTQQPQHLVPPDSSFCHDVSKQALAKPVFLSLNFLLCRKLHAHSYSCLASGLPQHPHPPPEGTCFAPPPLPSLPDQQLT